MEARRTKLASRLGLVGIVALMSGGVLLGTAMSASAATPTITLAIKTSAAGTCSGSVCMGLAGGDVVNVSGAGFSANQEASTLECNDDPTQPVIVFLGNAVPVSCTPIVHREHVGDGNVRAVSIHAQDRPDGTPGHRRCTDLHTRRHTDHDPPPRLHDDGESANGCGGLPVPADGGANRQG